jgi:hypothetical protein
MEMEMGQLTKVQRRIYTDAFMAFNELHWMKNPGAVSNYVTSELLAKNNVAYDLSFLGSTKTSDEINTIKNFEKKSKS